MESMLTYFQGIFDFINTGIYDLLTQFLAMCLEYFLVGAIKTKIFFVSIAWGVAENLIINMGLSELINNSWGSLDNTLLSYLTFFRLPEGVNILLQAVITRFAMNVVGL